MTVRRVINMLGENGLVTAFQGKGTFVKHLDLGEATFGLEGLREQLSSREDATVRLLEARVVTADEKVARKLAVAEGSRVVYLRRLLLQGDSPVMYHREYLLYDPRRPLVEAELDATTMEGLLRGHGGEGLQSGELAIEAVTLREEEALLLEAAPASAAFHIEHVFYDFDARPVSWGWFICRADRFKLRTRIGPGTGQEVGTAS